MHLLFCVYITSRKKIDKNKIFIVRFSVFLHIDSDEKMTYEEILTEFFHIFQTDIFVNFFILFHFIINFRKYTLHKIKRMCFFHSRRRPKIHKKQNIYFQI